MFKTEIKITLFLFCFLGIPQKTGTATLTINVADINDEYPRIKGVPYAKIMENQPAVTKVTRIFGQDPDSAENGPPFGFEAIPCTNNEPQCKFTVNFLPGKLIFFYYRTLETVEKRLVCMHCSKKSLKIPKG